MIPCETIIEGPAVRRDRVLPSPSKVALKGGCQVIRITVEERSKEENECGDAI
jgi:hypothetical protein